MSEIEARTVTRYYCKACGKGYQQKGRAAAHAEECWKDPEQRACPTCTFYRPIHPYSFECAMDVRDVIVYQDYPRWIRHCGKWEPMAGTYVVVSDETR